MVGEGNHNLTAGHFGVQANNSDAFPIFFRDRNRIRQANWNGHNWSDLLDKYCEAFKVADRSDFKRHHFYLRHHEHDIFYENWALQDLEPGSVVEVRPPASVKRAQALLNNPRAAVEPQAPTPATARAHKGFNLDLDTRKYVVEYFARKHGRAKRKEHPLRALRKRLWAFLDDSNSSTGAMAWATFIILIIFFSTVTFCVETLPYFTSGSESEKTQPFATIEIVNVSIFTFEFVLRLMCTPDQKAFWVNPMNLVDFIAIIPFYIELIVSATSDGKTPTLQVFRILRLVRIFRLFRSSRAITAVLSQTLLRSAKPLYMLVFFTCLGVVFFSSLLYYAERGEFDTNLQIWKRILFYQCRVNITAPDGGSWTPLSPPPLSGLPTPESPNTPCVWQYNIGGTNGTVAEFICPYRFPKNRFCRQVHEISPYESIPAAFWWCIVTITTTGYGDVTPTQWYGKALAMVAMLSGILVLALPITIIGANFAAAYDEYMDKGVKEDAISAAQQKPPPPPPGSSTGTEPSLKQSLGSRKVRKDD